MFAFFILIFISLIAFRTIVACKLDGVGPVDNIPSTKKLHHFVKKIKKIIWHVTPGSWHLAPDTWHVTCDTWWRVNILLKFQVPSSNGLGFMMSWRLGGKDDSMNQWMNESVTEVVVEQPWLHWVFYHMFLMCFFFNISHTKDIHNFIQVIFLM